jgi:hypothetical protein
MSDHGDAVAASQGALVGAVSRPGDDAALLIP